jgi:cell wall-associated NlpC family hydrolase
MAGRARRGRKTAALRAMDKPGARHGDDDREDHRRGRVHLPDPARRARRRRSQPRAGRDRLLHRPGQPAGRVDRAGAPLLGLAGREVTEEQMRALFGHGEHPDADAITAAYLRVHVHAGMTGRQLEKVRDAAIAAARLGRAFPAYQPLEKFDTRVNARLAVIRQETSREPTQAEEKKVRAAEARRQRAAVAGFDLVFSPVKSAALLWAVDGRPWVREAIREAHEAAMREALDLVEEHAAFTRTGTGGIAQVETNGLTGASFEHWDSPVSAGQAVDGVSLDSAQMSDARVIYDVGASMGLPQRAAVIAEATSMQESRLLDLPSGTSDSLGLFQQRPSMGWGTPAQIMQPVYAATQFYTALAKVPDWQSLPLTVAAQDVQRSEFPDAYAKWEPLGDALAATFSGKADDCLTGNGTGGGTDGGIPVSGAAHPPKGFALPPGTPATVATAIGYAIAQVGKPYIWGGTGPAGYDCSGLVMMAYRAAGIDLPRTTYGQVDAGTPVYTLSQLQPGDLLFTPGSDGTAELPGHVGMYIGSYHGQGLVVQAPKTGEDIKITPLAGYWAEQTVAIRRVA